MARDLARGRTVLPCKGRSRRLLEADWTIQRTSSSWMDPEVWLDVRQ